MVLDNLSRRSFVKLSGSSAAAAGLGFAAMGLAGCGNNGGSDAAATDTKSNVEPQNGSPATTPLENLPLPEKGKVYTNPKNYDEVQDGGTLVLPAGEVGPNWNYFNVEGNTVEMLNYWAYYMPDMLICDATASKMTPDPNFITNLSSSEETGKLVVTVDFNEKAAFNDGTPIDYKALAAVWTVMNGKNEAYTPSATDGYDKIESIEAGTSDKQAVITFSEPVYPFEPIVTKVLHPSATDVEVYTNGWNNNPHSEWGYGPYKVDSVSDTQVVFVPNEKWWGNPAKLDSITYKQMESQALYNAFKNGEIDATGVATSGTAEMLSNFSSMEDATIRRSDGLACYMIEVNVTHDAVKDVAVRKALALSIDVATVRNVMWQGVNWSEEVPGSLLCPTWASGYEDNRPDDLKNVKSAEDGTAAAKKTLEDAGYTLGSDGFYAKDGTTVTMSFVIFGDSNTIKNRAAAIQKMAKDAGINIEIVSKPSSEFSSTLTGGDWDIVLFGWQASSTYMWNMPQIYGSESASNFTHYGTPELDAEMSKIITISDRTEQMKALNAAEKKCMESYAFIPIYSGPDVVCTKATLANYGPALFETFDATKIGWEK